ncbi:Phosphoribosyl-ATP pyrophosphohydrolase [compost metagenome]
MSKKEVQRFNYGINNSPSMGDHYEVWKQLRLQAKLILEEAQELVDATTNEDMIETLDAYCDIQYLNTWLEHLLYAFGCNTDKAFAEVCFNNSSKITTSYTYAQTSKEHLEHLYEGQYYIDETVYEGETLYCVKRAEDGKVMKLKSHCKPNLQQYVLEEFK